jgi:heme A synthase
MVTTEGASRSIPDWPLAFGSLFPAQIHAPGVLIALVHRYIAAAALILVAGLLILAYRTDRRASVRKVAATAFLLIVIQALLGGADVLMGGTGWLGVAHAGLAQFSLLAAAAVAFVAWPSNGVQPAHVHDYGWPSLRTLAIWTPILVFVQIMLGALYRHHIVGLIPHIVGAMIVGVLVLLFSLFTLTQFPTHDALRNLATAVLLVLVCQLVLGVITYISGAANEDQGPPTLWAALVTAGHVAGGGVLLVFCSLLAVQVRRCVMPKLAQTTGVQAAS